MDGQGMWEGLGGPVRMDPITNGIIDPTLDDCCRREVESNRRYNALTSTLRRFDVVAQAERRRRNLVTTPSFTGCRCCYDPNGDGAGEYRALIELRQKRQKEKKESSLLQKNHQKNEQDFGPLSINGTEEPEQDNNDDDDQDDDSDDEFDYLLDEDLPGDLNGNDNGTPSLKELEDVRRAELEFEMLSHEVALQHGYGALRQLHPTRLLKAAGLSKNKTSRDPPPAVVVHLVDPDSKLSASLDLYIEELLQLPNAPRGTIFLRSGGRTVLYMDSELAKSSLPSLDPERDLPTLIAIRDGVVVNTCPTLRGLYDNDDEIVPNAINDWLDKCGVWIPRPPPFDMLCHVRPEEDALMDYLANAKPVPEREHNNNIFNCGLTECNKTYPHEHVGIKTSEQDGLVVSENEIVQK